MLLKWEAFVNTATSGWGSGRAVQRSKSVYNIKPALAVRSERLRKQEAPCGDPYSSSLFALLFLPTELRVGKRLSNQNLRFLDTSFPGGFHIQRALKKQIRKWKKVWKQMSVLDARAAMLLSWLEQQHRLISPREQVDTGVSDKGTVTGAASQWGHEGRSQLSRNTAVKRQRCLDVSSNKRRKSFAM